MTGSQLLTLQVSDLVNWYRNGELTINEDFQRRAVWNNAAKTYLIDTLLRGLPIPKIYIRTKVDPVTQRSVREVVDGQQRIRALVEFANNELRLTGRSADFKGMRYSTISEDYQQRLLGYLVSVEQLLNANDDDVLEVFARLNSYTVVLNDAEKRHAEFQTEFKWAVRETAQAWHKYFDESGIVSLRQRFRMLDDEFVAEMYRVRVEGVCDGGAPKLKAFYKDMTDDVFDANAAKVLRAAISVTLKFLRDSVGDAIRDELAKPHHVLMMFAAYNHHRFGIPKGDLSKKPRRRLLAAPSVIRERLAELLDAMQSDDPPEEFVPFVLQARKTSPQRIASREIRFNEMVRVFAA